MLIDENIHLKIDNIDFTKCKIYPFVKWVGGKKLVIDNYLKFLLPSKYNNYLEAFAGGASMLWYLKPRNAKINDVNKELIISYEAIRDNCLLLMKKLDYLTKNHNEENYYKVRSQKPRSKISIAARFIYLNKTCFNGIYRVNSKGLFNVPSGKKDKLKLNLYDEKNLNLISNYLNENNIEIFNMDYLDFLNKAKKNDFVFVDSPYDYETGTKGFDSYNKETFGVKNQILLANKIIELSKKGVKFMITNHSTKLIKELYKDFKIKEIITNRSINSNGTKRKEAAVEVVITNY